MTMEIEIDKFSHGDDELWSWIGRYGFDPKIRKVLGGPLSSYEDTVWFLALDYTFQEVGRVDLAGFAALKVHQKTLAHLYILSQYRSNGLAERLTNERIAEARMLSLPFVRVVLSDSGQEIYQRKWGFEHHRKQGKWNVCTLGLES